MKTSLLVRRRLLGGGFSPSVLFAGGEPGVWYDPSDLTTMFQDRAGTTLVTTPGQSVGLVLDKRLGLTPGPELVTNGTFNTDVSGWTLGVSAEASIAFSSGEAVVTNTASAFERGYVQTLTLVVGRMYEVNAIIRRTDGSGSATIAILNNAESSIIQQSASVTSGTSTSVQVIFTATETNNKAYMRVVGSGTSAAFDNISVRELPGNHMVATADASRGTYGIEPFGGRRNLLTFTEQFENAAWNKTIGGSGNTVTSNTAIAPDGTTTADTINFMSGTDKWVGYDPDITLLSGQTYTFSVWIRRASGSSQIRLNINPYALSWTDVTVTSEWTRVSVTQTSATTTTPAQTCGILAVNSTSDQIYVWGAQLELGSTATPYQRVTTAFDVTEAGVPTVHYVQFDGADDGYLTSTITPNTDKVQVFAGVRKLSDVAVGVVVEGSTAYAANNGSFALYNQTTAGWGYNVRGSVNVDLSLAAGYAAPISNVLSGTSDISGDCSTLRINGTQVAQSTADQGTGNFRAYPLYIGRRGGTSLPFNGRLYQLAVRFGPNLDAARIAQVERFIAQRTGVTL